MQLLVADGFQEVMYHEGKNENPHLIDQMKQNMRISTDAQLAVVLNEPDKGIENFREG